MTTKATKQKSIDIFGGKTETALKLAIFFFFKMAFILKGNRWLLSVEHSGVTLRASYLVGIIAQGLDFFFFLTVVY